MLGLYFSMLLLLSFNLAEALDVHLAWDPYPDDHVGFKLYRGLDCSPTTLLTHIATIVDPPLESYTTCYLDTQCNNPDPGCREVEVCTTRTKVPGNTSTYTDTTALGGNTYKYALTAYTDTEESNFSNTLCVDLREPTPNPDPAPAFFDRGRASFVDATPSLGTKPSLCTTCN